MLHSRLDIANHKDMCTPLSAIKRLSHVNVKKLLLYGNNCLTSRAEKGQI
jgi:hypothetical protein